MNTLKKLTAKYPATPVIAVRHELDETDFADQKSKLHEYPVEGGAIGIVWVSGSEVVLTKRTRPHKGWALPGGRVEMGEEFDAAFLRELAEETSLAATITRLLMIEEKVFVSPLGEELPMLLAVFEARAQDGRQVATTDDARLEGLEVATFSIDTLPTSMVLKDRQKLDLAIGTKIG